MDTFIGIILNPSLRRFGGKRRIMELVVVRGKIL